MPSRRTAIDASTLKRSETHKDSGKRKRSDDSRNEGMQSLENDLGRREEIQVSDGHDRQQGDQDDENENMSPPAEQDQEFQAMEASIQNTRQKMDMFTQQVSGLLEAGKTFLMDAATAFEERIVQLHQKQIEKWEQEIELLRTMDAINDDMTFRLADARAAIRFVTPADSLQPI